MSGMAKGNLLKGEVVDLAAARGSTERAAGAGAVPVEAAPAHIHVRAARAADLPAIGGLFQRVFRHSDAPAPPALLAYLERAFIRQSHLAASPEGKACPSLVHAGQDGAINGFIGVIAMPYLVEGVRRQAAFAGTLMVDERLRDPLAGARLLRGFMAGPQDLTLSETANEVSQGLWRRLRGLILPGYSLEWMRVFDPAAFALATAALRRPGLRRLRPTARPIDAVLRRLAKTAPRPCDGSLGAHAIDDEALVDLLVRFTDHHAARPDWAAMNMGELLADARSKSRYGPMHQHAVTRGGKPIGLFAYHAQEGGIAHVLQVAAAPGRMQDVVDRLFLHASERGLAGLRGRSQPALLEALMTRGCVYAHRSATVALARDKQLLRPIAEGDAFINGLAGETWIRLIGDDFENLN
jgi:hypothetical protein